MSMPEDKCSYFLSHRPSVRVDFAEQVGDPQATTLREAQAGAYWAVRGHFTASNDPALVVMPTGSGKTAVMTLLAFALVRERLLIIAPNRFIIQQVEEAFNSFEIARSAGSLLPDIPPPQVHVVNHRLEDEEAWKALLAYEVVIATPNCASPQDGVVCEPPPGIEMFDTIFFDEAHHLTAPTWERLVHTFPKARIVGFTATPYRRDKRPIPGDIVYNYPLSRAIAQGIYREIDFVPVEGIGDEKAKDKALAKKALETRQEMLDAGQPGKLLVRVAQLSETKAIRDLYKGLGIALEIVSSDYSLRTNRKSVQKVRQDECDGLLAVGMLGEGLDLPALQIGVLHRPYQSFPVTLQFMGRICRMSGQQVHRAKLLAIPDDVQEHTKGLYGWHADWAQLIPNLADAAVALEHDRRRFIRDNWGHPTMAALPTDVSLYSLKPSYAVSVYDLEGLNVDIARPPRLTQNTVVRHSEFTKGGRGRVVVTRTISNPVWTTSTSLMDVNYDLHIYFRVDSLLFEHTTAPDISQRLRKGFARTSPVDPPPQIPLLDRTRVEQILSQSGLVNYYSVGLRRAVTTSASVPTYKMMTGGSVESCISEADGQFFAVGHLFGRFEWDGDKLALGVAGQSGKVWAAARNSLLEFAQWCDRLTTTLTNNTQLPLAHLEHCRQPHLTKFLPADPYAVELHHKVYEHLANGLRIEVEMPGQGFRPLAIDGRLELEVQTGRGRPCPCLYLLAGDAQLPVLYDLRSPQLFQYSPQPPYGDCQVKVPESGGRLRAYQLDDYCAQYPPTLFLANGGSLQGRDYCEYQDPGYNLPSSLLAAVDWDALDCEIGIEDMELVRDRAKVQKLQAAGRCDVLDATAKLLKADAADCGVNFVFCDQGTGEIADFVAFQIEQDNMGQDRLRIHLYHCKASKTVSPGADVRNAYEVLGQARKCVRWLRRSDLFDAITRRLTMQRPKGSTRQRVVYGRKADFEGMKQLFYPQSANYSVHVVQPGFEIRQIRSWGDPSMRVMFLSLSSELRNLGVDFFVLGS